MNIKTEYVALTQRAHETKKAQANAQTYIKSCAKKKEHVNDTVQELLLTAGVVMTPLALSVLGVLF